MKLFATYTAVLMMAGSMIPVNAEEHTPLGKEMESISDAFKALNKEKDATKGAALAREAQDGILKGIVMVPDFIKDMVPDPKDKAKAVADYRKMMAETFVLFCKIETAFLEGKMDEVTKLAAEAKKMKKEGHNKYIEEE